MNVTSKNYRHSIKNIVDQVRAVMEKKYGVHAGEHYKETATMVAEMLRALDVKAQVVEGWYMKEGKGAIAHAWVETDNLFIDAAADRFNDDQARIMGTRFDRDYVIQGVVISQARPERLYQTPERSYVNNMEPEPEISM